MKENKTSVVKPFLKWAGGKRQLLNILKSHIPSNYLETDSFHEYTYYEPFIGAGALFFDLKPKNAVINDNNAELINCYKVIKNDVEGLIENLKIHQNNKEYFYEIRAWDRHKDFKEKTPIERCSRIIFLNKTCYNGLFRVNSKGNFNVPFGNYKNPQFLQDDSLRAVSEYLNDHPIEILNSDFRVAVKNAKKGDFIYFDPPYDPVSETASFTSYGANKFDQNAQQQLKLTFDELTQKGCRVLLSNSDTVFIRELYQDTYNIMTVSATRAINSNALKRGKINEVLIKNYD